MGFFELPCEEAPPFFVLILRKIFVFQITILRYLYDLAFLDMTVQYSLPPDFNCSCG
jgi:hypothetical protein